MPQDFEQSLFLFLSTFYPFGQKATRVRRRPLLYWEGGGFRGGGRGPRGGRGQGLPGHGGDIQRGNGVTQFQK